MIATALVTLLSGDICAALAAREPMNNVVVVGAIGKERRHNWTWVSGFGCGDRTLHLGMPDANVRESKGGRELLERLEHVETEMVNQSDFGPRHDTGIRVRLSGNLTWDGLMPILQISEIDVLETGE